MEDGEERLDKGQRGQGKKRKVEEKSSGNEDEDDEDVDKEKHVKKKEVSLAGFLERKIKKKNDSI